MIKNVQSVRHLMESKNVSTYNPDAIISQHCKSLIKCLAYCTIVQGLLYYDCVNGLCECH